MIGYALPGVRSGLLVLTLAAAVSSAAVGASALRQDSLVPLPPVLDGFDLRGELLVVEAPGDVERVYLRNVVAVVFGPDAHAGSLQRLLDLADGELIGGIVSVGAYLLRVPDPGPTFADLSALLMRLERDPDVFQVFPTDWTRENVRARDDRRPVDVSGIVTEGDTGDPIEGAILEMEDPEVTARSDSAGHFRFREVPPGERTVRVRRVGYRPEAFAFTVAPGSTNRLPEGQVALTPMATPLDPILVEGAPFNFRLAGFEARREVGIGDFLTFDEVERLNPNQATDLLRHLPSIRVRPNPNYLRGAPADTRRWLVENRRVPPSNAGAECPSVLVVDGVYEGNTRTTDVDLTVFASDIVAVESYSAGQVPPEFNYLGASCGAIVIWTR